MANTARLESRYTQLLQIELYDEKHSFLDLQLIQGNIEFNSIMNYATFAFFVDCLDKALT